jgi:copper transport protein
VFFPVNVLHVLAASVWVGGIVAIVLALPLATRAVEPAQRTPLLLDVLGRFSPLALAAVAVIACTGIVEAYIDVRTVHALTTTTYGELVLLKTGLLGILIGLGAINRERIIPTLRRLVAAAATPGQTGVLLRQTTRGELAAMASVFGVTAALVAFAPPIDVANGPLALSARLGPAELEASTSGPPVVGANSIHLQLFDAQTGAPYTQTKQLTITAALPSKGISGISVPWYPAGPGHYIANLVLSPAGTWSVEITDRVSLFDEYSTTLQVPVG